MSDAGADTTLLQQTLSRLFTERSGQEARQGAEAEGWAADCWDALAESGLPWVGVSEAAGGSGGDVSDACTLVRLAGRHAVPLPLAECSLIGGWLVAAAGLQLPGGEPISVAIPRPGDRVTVENDRVTATLQRVPWGARAGAVVALTTGTGDRRAVLLDPKTATIARGRSVAGEPRDALSWDGAPIGPEQVGDAPDGAAEELTVRGVLSRALLMAGAMEAAAEIAIEYSGQRHQFGKPIATFQAVANRLVRLSSEAEAGVLATDVAARRFADAVGAGRAVDAAFEVAVAKAATSRAASEVTTHAHQVHGAIGMTQEYVLHHFTRRLWAWRQEWGSERSSARAVGAQVVAAGADQLWPRVATGLVAAS
jgi:acyl-CoA dehydrogenase